MTESACSPRRSGTPSRMHCRRRESASAGQRPDQARQKRWNNLIKPA